MEIAAIRFAVFFAYAAAALFERSRVPDVLLLILLGILAGPIFHLTDPADFGKVGGVIGTVALVVLLFEGGASLNLTTLARSPPATPPEWKVRSVS